MKIIIHRGTHQIGGVATEIRTEKNRIIIDMGDELSLDPAFISQDLHIPGVTDANGNCDAVLFTHNHGDHIGQFSNIRDDIPLYMGSLARDVLLTSDRKDSHKQLKRIKGANLFIEGQPFFIGDMKITPYSIDHSACDSYMLLIEAEGKKILHTGDFRMHGFRGKAIPKILDKLVRKVDVLITEGTTLSRPTGQPMTEHDLQQKAKTYLQEYKYVFVYCASTNLERICALSKAVPIGKYFICDSYQSKLLDLVQQHWQGYSNLYRNIKKTVYGNNLLAKFTARGFLMTVRDNRLFRKIIPKFDTTQSIILYSMWDGYRTKPQSTIPDFLSLAGRWESLHTSGHASINDICTVIEKTDPEYVIPIHTEQPDMLKALCPKRNIVILQDGKGLSI